MADSFDDRRRGHEAKYQLDQEAEFRAQARRNRLFGLWAAGRLGRTGEEAEAYARTVVAADFRKPGHDDVIEKVAEDFTAAAVAVERAALVAEYERALSEARRQIAEGLARG